MLRFFDLNNVANTQQIVTLTFSKPIQNLSFSFLDIDSQRQGNQEAYEDLVIINTPGWTATKHSNVIGSGTAAAPYRPRTTTAPSPAPPPTPTST